MDVKVEPHDVKGTSFFVRFVVQGTEMHLKVYNVRSSRESESKTLSEAKLEGGSDIQAFFSGFEDLIQQRLNRSRDLMVFISELKQILDSVQQVHFKNSPPPTSWYHILSSEMREIGWDSLESFGENLTSLSFAIQDKHGKERKLTLSLPPDYPSSPPSIAADVPYACKLQWSNKCRLKDALCQFHMHLEKFEEFWSVLDDIGKNLWVLEPQCVTRATSFRHINIGNDVSILLLIDPTKPTLFPQCRFFGPDGTTDSLRQKWKGNAKLWRNHISFHENLANVLGINLPGPPSFMDDQPQVECGICYACYLPQSNEAGVQHGSMPDFVCDNIKCARSFHSICLRDWLRSITTTRQSFDVLSGSCPYCSEHIAIHA